jgi:hypothetical protein
VAYNVHAGAPFRDEMVVVVVAVDKMRNPALSNVLFRYIGREISDHGSRRR